MIYKLRGHLTQSAVVTLLGNVDGAYQILFV